MYVVFLCYVRYTTYFFNSLKQKFQLFDGFVFLTTTTLPLSGPGDSGILILTTSLLSET